MATAIVLGKWYDKQNKKKNVMIAVHYLIARIFRNWMIDWGGGEQPLHFNKQFFSLKVLQFILHDMVTTFKLYLSGISYSRHAFFVDVYITCYILTQNLYNLESTSLACQQIWWRLFRSCWSYQHGISKGWCEEGKGGNISFIICISSIRKGGRTLPGEKKSRVPLPLLYHIKPDKMVTTDNLNIPLNNE